jgi:subtilisin family serine protease
MTARRQLLSAAVLAGLLTTCGLPLSAEPARAEPSARASFELTPGPAEWWLTAWQVQRKVWLLTKGAGVTVGEVESGVQATIPDLRGVVLPGADLTGTGGNGDTDIQVGEDGHGTAMAVVIAGQGAGTGTVGIAPRSRILPVIVGGSGPASVRTAAAGIRYAVSHGAQVINLPFGIGGTSPASCDPVLQAAVAYALGRDVVLVASSGNASRYAGPGEPASCAGVLAVGGTEPDGSLWRGSTRQPYVAVGAPADHMVYVGRDGRYTTTGAGTSFSAALTAGTAALIRSRYPDMPWYQVVQRLTGTATPAGRPVPNQGFGYGIINPARAVNAALDSFQNRNVVGAQAVLDGDDRLDRLQDTLVRELIDRIERDCSTAAQALDVIFIAESLERIGDHATNVAEEVILVAEARNVKHAEKLARYARERH